MGWKTFPVHPEEKKSLKSAKYSSGAKWGMTDDPKSIRRDFERFKPRRIGIPTGAVNGIIVVETDTEVGHGVDGGASMRKLEAEHDPLPDTLMAESPSGSIHRYFNHPGGYIRCTASVLAPGIDVKGDGGMVVAPPSVNPDGRAYRWLNWGTPIADAPEWLAARLRTDDEQTGAYAFGFDTEPEGDIGRLAGAMAAIPNGPEVGWADWNDVGMALWRATRGSDEGFALFDAWSKKHEDYDDEYTARRWRTYATCPPTKIGASKIFRTAKLHGYGVSATDFYANMEMHNYIFAPTRSTWPASSVNARLPPFQVGVDRDGKPKTIPANVWLDQNRPVEQMTWAPGEPMVICDRLISEGGWIPRPGVSCFNLYRPPTIVPSDASQAGPWRDHVRKVYPDDADHIILWLAHRVQRPQEKINHALVFGGAQGIGKDTIIEPVKRAVGPWNVAEINPKQGMGRFNGFVKSVILRINEARDLGDADRYQLYEHLKPYTASPPDVLLVDEKNLREYRVLNCTGVIITTNNQDSLYLPADDRRYYVAWSPVTKEDFTEEYWGKLWSWYDEGGDRHVAAYLAELDLSNFNPKAPPPKTEAFWVIVDLNRAPEDDELADALDKLGNPDAATIDMIADGSAEELHVWLTERKNRRAIPHRMRECGYVPVRNKNRKDGRWIIDGIRHVIYAKAELPLRDRHVAATRLVEVETARLEAERSSDRLVHVRPIRHRS